MGTIKNLVLLFLSAFLCAILLVATLAYNSGPSGRYLGKTVMLSSEFVQQISYNDINAQTGANARFIFDKIEFRGFNALNNRWISSTVPLDQYAVFYGKMAEKKSISNASKEVEEAFSKNRVAVLSVIVKIANDSSWGNSSKTIQKIEFAEHTSFFRVTLREQNSSDRWAYFDEPNSYIFAMQLFSPGGQIDE